MAEPDKMMVQNRSTLKEFVASIATMSGDLSNITAPPFVLDTKSTVELPQYWADHPSIFCAPARSSDPAERAMLVLRWYLSSLRNQNYMGRGENEGVKKPLNAFLGELFLGRFEGEEGIGETRLVGEQVSHHPPITACRVWNDTHGVSAEGYTRQTITFGGNVTIQQTGHALFKLTKHDNESYLIPLPTLKVRGILTGAPYPELGGKYYIPSTSGYVSVIDFSGRSWFSGKKNSLSAKVYHEDAGEDKPLYTVKGQWNGEFIIHDVRKGEDIETFNVAAQASTAAKLIVDPLDEQDPWETRRAWKDVISSLNHGDMPGTSKAKSVVEQGQRNMRKDDAAENRKWETVFFRCTDSHKIAETLEAKIPGHSSDTLQKEKKDTLGIWVFEEERWREGAIQKPYHGDLVPDNSHSDRRYSVDSRRDSGVWADEGRFSEDGRRRSSVSTIYSVASSRRDSMQQPSSSSTSVLPPNGIPSHNNSNRKLSTTSAVSSGPNSPRLSPLTSARRSSEAPRDPAPDLSMSISSLHSSLDSIKNVAKEQPGPQADQAFTSQEQKRGSGIDGMSLQEKGNVEDFLREQYSSRDSGHGGKRLSRGSGLRQEVHA